MEEIGNLLTMRWREVVHRILVVGTLMSTALVVWRCFSLLTHCDNSVVAVLSGSMEPGYSRGDILFLHHWKEFPVLVGDIVVYNLPGRLIPIVHRVLCIHRRNSDSKKLILTKGDNNKFDDRALYTNHEEWLEEDTIVGKSFSYLPQFGYLTILVSSSPVLKGALIVFLALVAMGSNDT